ncbi:hypothetical protein SB2_07510 [Methylobacterium radiotolerans]|nr:hypothetical protein SB3_06310 [Methylobacterium radiotolerans]KTS49084.1 hypothetical protein SB2_07510 [Methylobacterium radiotolerans]
MYPSEATIVAAIYGPDAAPEMAKAWDGVATVLERDGLPKRDPLFGNRRYWPAVEAFLRRRNGIASPSGGSAPDGEEDWT